MQDFDNVQDKHVDYELRQNDHRGECDVILQIIVANLVVVCDFSLVCKKEDKDQSEWYQEKSLCLT